MKKQNIIKGLFILCFCSFIHISGYATNLRGQILHNNGNRNTPLANVRVDLMIFNQTTHSWQDVSNVMTGADGFYYFLNFTPNQIFYISVWNKFYPPTQNPLTILNVNPTQPPYYQDIPAIIL